MPLTLRLVNETTLSNGGPVSIQLSGQRAVRIGRAVDLSWTLPDPARFVSNKHCEIRYQDGGYWLYDVSSNGTFLNGAVDRMRAPHLLRNGDRFAVGHYLVAVTLDGAEEAAEETRSAPIASPAYVPGGRDLWADEADFQPAIGRKRLQPAQNGPVDWLADIPDSRVPVASLPARAESTPASPSAIGAVGPAGPQLLQQPPPLSGEKRSSIGPVVPFGRDDNSGVRVTSPPQRGAPVKRSGRIMSHWIVPVFGAGLLLTAFGVATFFLTSSRNLPPPATETTQAEPLLTPGRILDESALADSPEPVIPADNLSSNSAENLSSNLAEDVSPNPAEAADKLAPASTERPYPLWPEPRITPAAAGNSPQRQSTKFADRTSNDWMPTAPATLPVFEGDAATYWRLISEKRHLRGAKHLSNQQVLLEDYMLAQPPQHQVWRAPDEESTRSPDYIPVAADFLKAAAKEFNFVPERPAAENEFKKAYAQLALSAGLTKDQIVRIYAFETGGNGTYETQAGLEYHRPGERAVSPAIGYNQLLSTNSVELLAEYGDSYLQELQRIADKLTGSARTAMQQKIEAIRRMVAFSRTVPDAWQEHDRLAKTEGGRGLHALLFDRDIGPLLQTQKLFDSLLFARKKGFSGPLTAAELELMNLTGDGNGFDMVLMPPALRVQVPTANFFQQNGYEHNAIARRTGTVAALIAVIDAQMDKDSRLPGARELAAAF
jgi:FHA domain